jgi:hypothetical protein
MQNEVIEQFPDQVEKVPAPPPEKVQFNSSYPHHLTLNPAQPIADKVHRREPRPRLPFASED